MNTYPSYKDSGVEWIGEIPGGWVISKLKYDTIKPVMYGINISGDKYIEKGIRFIRITDLTENGELINTNGKYLNTEDVPEDFLLNKSDVLMCRSGHTVGKSYLHVEEGKYTSGGYLVRFNFGGHIKSKFIFYITKTDFYEYWIKINTVKSTIENVNGEKYSNMVYPKPSHLEQQQIVDYLDKETSKIDKLIEKTEQKIELLKEHRTSLINTTVTKGLNPNVEMKDSGVEWIGEIPGGWSVKRLKYTSNILPSNVNKHIFPEEKQIRLCNYTDVYYNELIDGNTQLSKGSCNQNEYEKFWLRKGDVIITKDSETPDDIGIPTEVKEDLPNVVCGYHLTLIRPLEVIGGYVFRFIQSNRIRRYFEVNSEGVTRFGLGKPTIQNMYLPLPPIQEQQQIVDYLNFETSKIDKLVDTETKRISLLKEYSQSLISDVVTGKVDVRGEVLV